MCCPAPTKVDELAVLVMEQQRLWHRVVQHCLREVDERVLVDQEVMMFKHIDDDEEVGGEREREGS
jgi:hypothetical protein